MAKQLKNIAVWVLVLLILVGGGTFFYRYYSYIFARDVTGVIVNVQSAEPAATHYTVAFAIAIKTKTGEIVTGSSNDREWAVTKPGLCATARFLPYPPWELDKSGTYFGVRLLKLFECVPMPVPLPIPQPVTPQKSAPSAPPVTAPPAESHKK